MDAPCLKCEERSFGCHSKCEKYQKYHSQQIKISRERRKSTALNNLFVDDARKVQKINRRKK